MNRAFLRLACTSQCVRKAPPAAFLLGVLCASAAAAAEPPPASPQTTFFHANALYKDAQYAAAAETYGQLLRAGVESGNLYFNLGNAHFKAGAAGKAILNYERARRLLPRDADVEANLSFAQSLTGAEACTPPLWQRLAFPLASRLGVSGLVWGASLLYTFLLAALAVQRLSPSRPQWLVYLSGVLAVATLVTAASLGKRVLADDWRRQAVVVQSGDTPARFEPAPTGTEHFVLKEGTVVHILGRRAGWLQIARCDGRRAWVTDDAVIALRGDTGERGDAAHFRE